VIDEAQEFSRLELSLMGRSLTRTGSLVVAGDADQQTDPGAGFESWPRVMRALRAPTYATVELAISYRCPSQVVSFARALRAGTPPPATLPVQGFDQESALIDWIAHEAEQLVVLDPGATVCILCARTSLSQRIAAGLRGRVPCKLVLDGEFSFHRGVDVATVTSAKGLEFDYVIVADANAADYPATAAARRMLYVAVTRARYQAALAYVGAPSPLLAM
jgi:DNA helicase IV